MIKTSMVFARHISSYRSSDSNLVIELPSESIDLPFTIEVRDGMKYASLDENVLNELFSRDDVSLSQSERNELILDFCHTAEGAA